MIDDPVGAVGVRGDDSIIILPYNIKMTKDQAIDLAVRLVAVADDLCNPKFGKWLREMMAT